jgi:hypothetical protein
MFRFLKHLFLTVIICVLPFIISGQESCKVLVPEIAEQYIGKCKKGLANGKGLATGIDTYEGVFKKGYPEGKGTYTWSTGEVYTGEWLKGKRNGIGTYTYTEDGNLVVQEGVWKDDIYVGPVPEKPKVLSSVSIERYSFQRQGDGNQVLVSFYLNGSNNVDLENFSAVSTSGTKFESPGKVGFESIVFPFTCKISYNSWNKTRTSRVLTRFEFEITEPGRWMVNLYNN